MKPNAFLDAIRSGNGSQDHRKMPATKAAQCTLTVEPTTVRKKSVIGLPFYEGLPTDN